MMANSSVLKYEISLRIDDCDIDYEKKEEILREQALLEESATGNFEKVLTLLDTGVSVDAEGYNKLLFYASKNYMTPLQLAAANGHVECVQILIDHDADVNAKDRFDVTALHMAAEKGHYSCLRPLLEGGADCSFPTKYSKSGCYKAVPHLGGTTPLHLAAANNKVDCVKELIQYGADYNAVDECGRTSLYIAAQAGLRNCVLTQLRNAVGRDILSLPGYETHDTPLHFAVLHRMVDCVHELLCLGSDVNHLNIMGCSPLHIVLIPQNVNAGYTLEIVKLLVLEGYNTNINLRDSGHFTPLHYACFTGQSNRWLRRPEIAKFLISYGANVNIRNCRGSSLLQYELKSSGKDYEVLNYIVKSMLQLPHLNDLNLSLQTEPHPSSEGQASNEIENQRITAENEALANYRRRLLPELMAHPSNPVAMENILLETMPYLALAPLGIRPQLRPYVRNATNEPRPIQGHDTYGVNLLEDEDEDEDDEARNMSYNANEENWVTSGLEKRLWYEQLASNPRTLQHCCRYAVREALGSFRLKHVRKLPIPPTMQSYLLLEGEK